LPGVKKALKKFRKYITWERQDNIKPMPHEGLLVEFDVAH
jgi:hypothetical protein